MEHLCLGGNKNNDILNVLNSKTNEELQEIIKECNSFIDLCKQIEMVNNKSFVYRNGKIFKCIVISKDHFATKVKLDNGEIFETDHDYISSDLNELKYNLLQVERSRISYLKQSIRDSCIKIETCKNNLIKIENLTVEEV